MTLVAKSFFLLADSFGHHIGVPKWNTKWRTHTIPYNFLNFVFPNNLDVVSKANI